MYDAIIIGGGPAGCAAAYDMALEGLKVVILERKLFPRFKPCAGALTIKTLKRLRYPIEPVIQKVISTKIVGMDDREIVFSGNAPIAVTTIRQEFDAFCLSKTLDRGVFFEIIPGIDTIREEKHGVVLTDTHHRTFQARYLIGADGVHSQVRKLTHAFSAHRTALAIEGRVSLERFKTEPIMRFDYGEVANGYGWMIPKRDHINIGLYSNRPIAARISQSRFQAYIRQRTGSESVESVAGFPIGMGGERYQPMSERIFLVGDAAGLAEPLWGEGIHNAIKSGQAAAFAVITALKYNKNANQIYRKYLRDIQKDITECRKIASLLYHYLRFFYPVFHHPFIQATIMTGFSDGLTVSEIKHSFLSGVLKAGMGKLRRRLNLP